MAKLTIPTVVVEALEAIGRVLDEDLPIPHQITLPEESDNIITGRIKFYFGNGFRVKALIRTGVSEHQDYSNGPTEVEFRRWVIPLQISYEMPNLPEDEEECEAFENWFCELEEIVGRIQRVAQKNTLIFSLTNEQTSMLLALRSGEDNEVFSDSQIN